jgi:hypothetical protein
MPSAGRPACARAAVELSCCRNVLVGARDVPGDGLSETVAVEVNVDAGLLHAIRARAAASTSAASFRRNRRVPPPAFPPTVSDNGAELTSVAILKSAHTN